MHVHDDLFVEIDWSIQMHESSVMMGDIVKILQHVHRMLNVSVYEMVNVVLVLGHDVVKPASLKSQPPHQISSIRVSMVSKIHEKNESIVAVLAKRVSSSNSLFIPI
jgi:ribosome recycling factor